MSIESPCIQICSIHEASGHCHGCGRTVSEIMEWAMMSEVARASIADALPARMQALPKLERRETRRMRMERERNERREAGLAS